jgi:hypothetical protein
MDPCDYNPYYDLDTHLCSNCGQEFDEWILYSKASMKECCKPCHYARAGKRISQAMRKQREDFDSDDFKVTLDFNQHRELFSALEVAAKRSFRNLDQQIMCMASNIIQETEAGNLMPGVSDDPDYHDGWEDE